MRTRIAALVLLAALTAPAPSHAAWPLHASAPGTIVSDIESNEYSRTIVSDGRGGVIVVIESYRASGTGYYAQRIGLDGSRLWTANGVRVGALGSGIVATPDGLGGVLIAWLDESNGTSNSDIRAQRVDSTGTVRWGAEGVIVCNHSSDQSPPQIAADPTGGVVVTWSDTRNVAISGTDVFAQRVLAAGTVSWTANGATVCNATNTQIPRAITRDLGNTYVIAMSDLRNSSTLSTDIYAQRMSSGGARQWGSTGVPVVTALNDQTFPRLLPAPDGGTFVVWSDNLAVDVSTYAQRLDVNGTTQWSVGGVELIIGSHAKSFAGLCPSADGLIVLMSDSRSGNPDVYAQRLNGLGVPMWSSTGALLIGSSEYEVGSELHADGLGGAIALCYRETLWPHDFLAQRVNINGTREWGSGGLGVAVGHRLPFGNINSALTTEGALVFAAAVDQAGSGFDVLAWRVDKRGVLGDPRPAITRVSDVLADQGGRVAVEWTASTQDAEPDRRVVNYSIWRDVPAALVSERARLAKRPLRAEPLGATTLYWEYVSSVPARARPGYSAVVATTTDSMPGSNPLTSFMVSAETSNGTEYWDSAPASGYSIDNLAPAAPAPFTGQYGGGTTALHWNRNLEPDLAGYRLYRGTSMTFPVDPSTFVAGLPDTGYIDAAGLPYFYKLTAIDVHGNESQASLLQPQGTLDVGDAQSSRAHFAAPRPNPVRAGVSSQLRFALSTAGRVRLALHDAQGRLVRELAAGEHAAGEHAVAFDGRDAAGRRLAPGLYLARIDAPGLRATQRVVVAD